MKKAIGSAAGGRRQHGFSILEILVAIVLISSLVASGLYYVNVGDKAAIADIAAAKTVIVVRFPEALMTIYARKQTLADTDADDLTDTGSVRAGSPVAWTVAGGDDAPGESKLSINLSFDEDSTAEEMKAYLDRHLDTTLVSETAISGDNSKVLKVTYSLR